MCETTTWSPTIAFPSHRKRLLAWQIANGGHSCCPRCAPSSLAYSSCSSIGWSSLCSSAPVHPSLHRRTPAKVKPSNRNIIMLSLRPPLLLAWDPMLPLVPFTIRTILSKLSQTRLARMQTSCFCKAIQVANQGDTSTATLAGWPRPRTGREHSYQASPRLVAFWLCLFSCCPSHRSSSTLWMRPGRFPVSKAVNYNHLNHCGHQNGPSWNRWQRREMSKVERKRYPANWSVYECILYGLFFHSGMLMKAARQRFQGFNYFCLCIPVYCCLRQTLVYARALLFCWLFYNTAFLSIHLLWPNMDWYVVESQNWINGNWPLGFALFVVFQKVFAFCVPCAWCRSRTYCSTWMYWKRPRPFD